MNKEIELKFFLLNKNNLIEVLNKKAKRVKTEEYQKDTYYTPSDRNFVAKLPIEEWLRIREEKKQAYITYKFWHYVNGQSMKSCDEYETAVSSPEIVHSIFKQLHFKSLVTVVKIRSSWLYKEVEISIDSVTDLGDFIELEAKGAYESVKDALKQIHLIIKELKIEIGEEAVDGYPYGLLLKYGQI